MRRSLSVFGAGRGRAAAWGLAAGIATGTLEGVIVRAVFPPPPPLPPFPWIAVTVVVGFGIAAAVGLAVMRALTKSTPRAPRVPVHGVDMRLANLVGWLVNISATGALVNVNGTLPVGSEWPLVLEPNSRPVEVWTRIARVVEPVSIESGATPTGREYALGLMFGELTPPAQHVVAQLCGGASADLQ